MITYEMLDVLENTDRASRIINREYSDQFKFGGAVLGQTLSIRKPARYIGRLGQAVSIEGITEAFVPLTLSFQRGVDTQVSSQDLELRIDDYRTRVLKPQIARLANLIDQDVCLLAQGLSNQVGVPGTTPNALTTYLSGKTLLDSLACPMDGDRHMILNPVAESTIVDALKGLFQDSEEIRQQYLEAAMGRAIGFEWAMDQNIAVLTVGTIAGTPTVNGANQSGASIITQSWSSGATTLNAGDIVSFVSTTSPTNFVNPQNYNDTGITATFVVTATTSDTSGAITIPIAPSIVGPASTTPSLQNVLNLPANSAAVYVYGQPAASFASITGKSTPQNLAIHKDFGTLAMVDLPLPGGTDKAYRAASPKTGNAIRVIRDYVASTDQWIQRLDVLYGVAVLRTELGCRVAG